MLDPDNSNDCYSLIARSMLLRQVAEVSLRHRYNIRVHRSSNLTLSSLLVYKHFAIQRVISRHNRTRWPCSIIVFFVNIPYTLHTPSTYCNKTKSKYVKLKKSSEHANELKIVHSTSRCFVLFTCSTCIRHASTHKTRESLTADIEPQSPQLQY